METLVKREVMVPEAVAETAMCIWEWVIEQLAAFSNHAKALATWRAAVHGTAQLRTECLDLAGVIEAELGAIEAEHGPIAWNDTFDWDIVPAIMAEYLDHIKQKQFHADPDMLRRIVRQVWIEDNTTAQAVENSHGKK